MNPATPSVGDMVIYKLKASEVIRINARRSDAQNAHVGNTAVEEFPMLIVRTWANGMVNGQVFLDGNDTLWVTSVTEGTEAGQFVF